MIQRIITICIMLTVARLVPAKAFDPATKACAGRPTVKKPALIRSANLPWFRGVWRSFKLDYGDFGEWEGTVQIELDATSPDGVGLFLIKADGKRFRAGDSEPGFINEKRLFFGPIGSGLLFRYQRRADVLIIDSNGIHAQLRKQQPSK